MNYVITFSSIYDYNTICESLSVDCHYNCPTGSLPCPFEINKNCSKVTPEDWKKVLKPVEEHTK